MTTEEYEEEHRKIGLEHEKMIQDATLCYGVYSQLNSQYKVERADRWLQHAVDRLDKRYMGF